MGKKLKAVSSLISTMILIVIVVSAGLTVFFYTRGLLNTEAQNTVILVENTDLYVSKDQATFTITIKNAGSKPFASSDALQVWLAKQPSPWLVSRANGLEPGKSVSLMKTGLTGYIPGETYSVSIKARYADGSSSSTVISVTCTGTISSIMGGGGGEGEEGPFVLLLEVFPTSITMPVSGEGDVILRVKRLSGSPEIVSFSAENLPEGVSVAFNPRSGWLQDVLCSTVTISVSSGASEGTYYVKFAATSVSDHDYAWLELNIGDYTEGDFELEVRPNVIFVDPGDPFDADIIVSAVAGAPHVELSAVWGEGSVGIDPEEGDAPFISNLAGVAPNREGYWEITIQGYDPSTGFTREAKVQLNVYRRSNYGGYRFDFLIDENEVEVEQGGQFELQADIILLSGSPQPAVLNAYSTPSFLSISFDPQRELPPFESTITGEVSEDAPEGTYLILLSATTCAGIKYQTLILNVVGRIPTQYYLSMKRGEGGEIYPPSGWYDAGATVEIAATPYEGGYRFIGWFGTGNGSYTGQNNPATVTMNGHITERALFGYGPNYIQPTIDLCGTWMAGQRKIFRTESGLLIAFYTHEDWYLACSISSDNGATWTTQDLDGDVDFGTEISAYLYGNKIHLVFATLGAEGSDVFYRVGTISGNTVTWGDWQLVWDLNSWGLAEIPHNVYIAVDSGGYPWISLYVENRTAGGISEAFVLKSSRNDGVWETAEGFPAKIGTYEWANILPPILPLEGSKVAVVLGATCWDESELYPLEIHVWNGAGWEDTVYSENYFWDGGPSAVIYGSKIYAAFVNPDFNIVIVEFDASTHSITKETVLPVTVVWSAPSLSVDAATGKLFLFWNDYDSSTLRIMVYDIKTKGWATFDWPQEDCTWISEYSVISTIQTTNGMIDVIYTKYVEAEEPDCIVMHLVIYWGS